MLFIEKIRCKGRSGGSYKSLLSLNIPQLQVIDSINFRVEKPKIEESFLKEKYLQEGLSSKEIAQISFSSRSTINKRLKKIGIPLKKITRRTNGYHVFGFKKWKGKCIELRKEQRVVRLICQQRIDGKSYQSIAKFLNDEGIETKLNQGIWYPKVIRGIYLRNSR